MTAKQRRSQSVFHFYLQADEDSVPPTGAEILLMLFLLVPSVLGIASLVTSGSFVGAIVLCLLCLLFLAIPGRVRTTPDGFEKRNLYGRGRSFGTRRKTLWGRRCGWSDVTRFDDTKNHYRRWLVDRLGERRLAIRAKGMPHMAIHSSYPSSQMTLKVAPKSLSG